MHADAVLLQIYNILFGGWVCLHVCHVHTPCIRRNLVTEEISLDRSASTDTVLSVHVLDELKQAVLAGVFFLAVLAPLGSLLAHLACSWP